MKCDEVQKFRPGIWVCFFNRTVGSMSLVTKTNTTCCNERHLLYSQQALKLTLLKVTFIFILRILYSSSFLCNFHIFFSFVSIRSVTLSWETRGTENGEKKNVDSLCCTASRHECFEKLWKVLMTIDNWKSPVVTEHLDLHLNWGDYKKKYEI